MTYTRVLFYLLLSLEMLSSRRDLKVELEEVDHVCVGISVLFLSLLGLELLDQFYTERVSEEYSHLLERQSIRGQKRCMA
jgi:hypothetical protein